MKNSRKLRDCVVCKGPVTDKPYQDPSKARTCRPICAKELAYREHPDVAAKPGTRTVPS